MDLRTGRTYETRAAALADGVPESDIVEVEVSDKSDAPIIRVAKGPFKGRAYRRTDDGHLVRIREVVTQ